MSSNTSTMSRPIEVATASGGVCPCCGDNNAAHWMWVPDRCTHWMQIPEGSLNGAGHELLCCNSCSHVWLGRLPTQEEISFYYGHAYHQAVSSSGEMSLRRWGRQLEIILQYKSGGDVLDIGCSSGGFLACLKDGPWRLYGIEADIATAERAHALTGARVFAGDVANASFPDRSFDVITCSDVLEHLPEPQEVFKKVYNWLKPGGVFYVFVPNICSWEARMFGSYWVALDAPRHLHHFSKQSLAFLATSINLRQVRMVTPPGSYLEHSLSILIDDFLRKTGLKRTSRPLDLTGDGGVAWRVARKGLRLTVESLYSLLAAYCGAAVSIQAVFQKDLGSNSPLKI